jgi:cobalt-zinc-cadmium efflux system membrane fusion protein
MTATTMGITDEENTSPGGDGPHRENGKRRKRTRLLVATGAAVVASLGVGWLASRPGPRATAATVEAAGNDAPVLDGDVIKFSPAFAKRAGITGQAVSQIEIAPLIQVTGTLTYDPRKFAALGARIDGRVGRVFKLPGDEVKAGEVVAEIESAELGRAEAAVLGARAKEKAAEADMKRERRLADARVTAERDAELAHATFEAARAERIAAERAVEALGGDTDERIGILPLKSPIAGRIVKADVARGQTVHPTDTLFEVAALDSLWVDLGVFERDLWAVRVGDKVELSAQTAGTSKLVGTVAHVGDVIDPESRTSAVRVVVENADRALRPGQSVAARIQTTAPAQRSLGVPRGAVTRIDGKPTVFVLKDATTVEARIVATGVEDGERTAIMQGVKEGEQVVVGGMFALKSEIYR